MTENMFFLCLSLNWIYLSQLAKVSDEKRSPGWVMAAIYVVNMISRAMCSKRINVIGLNLCLDFKKYSLCVLSASENQALLLHCIVNNFMEVLQYGMIVDSTFLDILYSLQNYCLEID